MSDTFPISQRPAPRSASTTRKGATISLIVFHYDATSSSTALERYTADRSETAPHYYIASDGTITQLVPEERAAQHSGTARLGRRRNIDRVSIGVVIEAGDPEKLNRTQTAALRWLTSELQQRYDLLADSALMLWEAPTRGATDGAVVPFTLPPAPPRRQAVLSIEEQERGRQAVLGIEDDPAVGQRMWVFLQNEAARQRGGEFKLGSAFHLHAAKTGMGAPLAPSSPRSAWITVSGRSFNYQHFARDTAFNEGEQWTAVRNLSELLEGSFPATGSVEFLLYQSAFAAAISGSKPSAGDTGFHPNWAFTQTAAQNRLGPALSGNYGISVGGSSYTLQVFGGDTLYTPVASPADKTDWQDVRRLSETPEGALREQLWAETYKPSGAQYNAGSPFQQAAAAAKIGAPLSGVYQANFEGTPISVQVFGTDTLYQVQGGPVKRQSALPQPPEVKSWTPKPSAALPTPQPEVKPLTIASATIAIPGGDRSSASWPPKPGFGPLATIAAQQQLFGTFEFVHDPAPNNQERIRILGDWVRDNIDREVFVPQLAKLAARKVPGAPRSGVISWHRKAKQQILGLWQAWEDAGLLDLIISYHGDWNARFVRGRIGVLSNHSFGTAFDINTVVNGLNWLGVRPALVGERGSVRELVPIAHAYGFYWGGHFDRFDGMHFDIAQLK